MNVTRVANTYIFEEDGLECCVPVVQYSKAQLDEVVRAFKSVGVVTSMYELRSAIKN